MSVKYYNEYAQKIFDENINMMVPWYLMASYAYYHICHPLFTDDFFDNMAKVMLENWDTIEHWHKELITVDDLKAGTYLGKYPKRVINSCYHLTYNVKV